MTFSYEIINLINEENSKALEEFNMYFKQIKFVYDKIAEEINKDLNDPYHSVMEVMENFKDNVILTTDLVNEYICEESLFQYNVEYFDDAKEWVFKKENVGSVVIKFKFE